MSGYRFHPLRDFPHAGVLISPSGKAVPAALLTPAQAKVDALNRPPPS